MKKKVIAVLMGGTSSEREISLLSGKEIVHVLQKRRNFEVKIYDPKNDLKKLIQEKDKIDFAIPILHGPQGEDGKIQGFLEVFSIPYTFSDVEASVLGMDKYVQKKLYQHSGILTAPFFLLTKDDWQKQIAQIPKSFFNEKIVIKPNQNGSSFAIFIVKGLVQVKKYLPKVFAYDKEILLEKYIKGKEITVAVLGKSDRAQALPVVEIVPPGEFFDYQCKYDGSTQEIVPARIPQKLTQKAKDYAIKVHRLLGCSGVTRTDMIIQNSKIYVLEINTIPGFTKESLVPKAAAVAGISFDDLVLKLIELAERGESVSEKT